MLSATLYPARNRVTGRINSILEGNRNTVPERYHTMNSDFTLSPDLLLPTAFEQLFRKPGPYNSIHTSDFIYIYFFFKIP